MLCRASEVSLWTINGDLMVQQNICVEGDDRITSCAFYEGHGNEYLERNLIFTGHKKGVVNVGLEIADCYDKALLTLRSDLGPDHIRGHFRS